MKNLEKHPTSRHMIYFQDCDALGHLNNARYLDYFINARESHLHDYYNLDTGEVLKSGKGWVVTGHEIVYLRPANLYEQVRIKTGLIYFDDSSLLVEHIMTDDHGAQLKSIMWTSYTFFNAQTGKRDKHTDELLALLQRIKLEGVPVEAGFKQRVASLRGG